MSMNISGSNFSNYLENINKEIDDLKIDTKEVITQSIALENEMIDPKEFVEKLFIIANAINMHYDKDNEQLRIYSKVGSNKTTKVFDMSYVGYENLLEEFTIPKKVEYNASKCWINNADDSLIRCFVMGDPIVDYPDVTFSISKDPDNFDLDPEIKKFIPDIVKGNFLIVGGTGAGKTVFMNQILREGLGRGKSSDRTVFVEEYRELFPFNENCTFLSIPAEIPGEPYLFDFTVRKTNLMRIDRLFVGETKGSEAFALINNLSAGVLGGTTVHGDSCEAGLKRLAVLATMAHVADYDTCCELIASSIEHIIYLKDYHVKEIKKLTGVYNKNNHTFQKEPVFGDV